MKYFYARLFVVLMVVVTGMVTAPKSFAQCPGGYTPGATAYDTTIAFGTGVTSTPVKFPQFDPQQGTVSCVRLCISITGIIDTLAIENFSLSPQTATFTYNRTDQLTGPGLSSPLSNTISQNYGPYSLAASDGVIGSGPDRIAFGHDTVLNKQLCRVLTDTATIAQFYGTDSVTYNYNISVSANASVTGGNNSVFVLTSALVNFHFEYCYCPPVILPEVSFPLKVDKTGPATAELAWAKPNLQETGDYDFEVEVSPDGSRFYPVATVKSEDMGADGYYRHRYTPNSNQETTYYFRVRVKYLNGVYRLSHTKSARLGTVKSNFTIFPNPSNGIVGIKFDGNNAVNLKIQIVNINGQTIYNGKFEAVGPAYKQITVLGAGMYWLRMTDVKGQQSSVNQLLVIK